MSLKLINSSIIRIGNQSVFKDSFIKLKNGCFLGVSKATITSKAFRDDKPKPPPFPYKEKKYSYLRSYFDNTTARIDENSKIIVVEGSVAVGKTKFAKKLAEELDFYHIGDANMDTLYVNSYGYDMRQLDDRMPPSMQSFDEKNFCKTPKHTNVANFQIWMYRLRYSLYIDAIAHLLSTGQGVVIERSPWSDIAFLEAMVKNNYISENAKPGYMGVRKNTLHELLRPHLVIYLDSSVEKIKEKIKCRGLPHEQNSPALTDQYLKDLEEFFKTLYLTDVPNYAELLMYDWSEEGDVEVVVEDIERIDFEGYTKYDEKFKDWFIGKEQDWALARHLFADKKDEFMCLFNVPYLGAPELLVSGEDITEYQKVIKQVPELEYEEGFNPKYESNLLFKASDVKYIKY